ncbi:hypothetical protein BGW37DRAFT_495078 [Umbelopsis sp. PMI_123]|jgi:hypothetical protein|nr:hypothetical protein BGW37DRAFT_495078 [Umbelopsis sp. PMI_123]
MALHYIILFLVFLKVVTFFVQSRNDNIEEDSVILSEDARNQSTSTTVVKNPPRYNYSIEVFGWSLGISVG